MKIYIQAQKMVGTRSDLCLYCFKKQGPVFMLFTSFIPNLEWVNLRLIMKLTLNIQIRNITSRISSKGVCGWVG